MFDCDTGLDTKYRMTSNYATDTQPKQEATVYVQLQQKMYGQEGNDKGLNLEMVKAQGLLNR